MPQVWEFVFLMLIMKLPIAYLCFVVYWAVKSEPRPPEYAALPARLEPEAPPPRAWILRRRSRRPGPHGSPSRSYARTARAGSPLRR